MGHSISSREVFVPGNVVKLSQPYKVEDKAMRQLLQSRGIARFSDWSGFTHGIIAELISPNALGIERVSLYLYDPKLSFLDLNPHTGIPRHVDFVIDQLEIVHVARFPRNKQPPID